MTKATSGRSCLLGSLRSADGKGVVRIEDRFDTDPEDLWSAITDCGRLGRWLGAFQGDFRLGGTFHAKFFASEWEGTGRVDACDPARRLLVHMTEPGGSEHQTMEVTLRDEGGQTVLVVEQRGLPSAQTAAYGAGLQVHVEDLAAYLAGNDRCDARARWSELFPSYQAKAIEPA